MCCGDNVGQELTTEGCVRRWEGGQGSTTATGCMGKLDFRLQGRVVMGAPQNWGVGCWKRAPMARAIIFNCAKGVRRKILSTLVSVKRELHACPPHAARMIQCMVLIMVYLSGTWQICQSGGFFRIDVNAALFLPTECLVGGGVCGVFLESPLTRLFGTPRFACQTDDMEILSGLDGA